VSAAPEHLSDKQRLTAVSVPPLLESDVASLLEGGTSITDLHGVDDLWDVALRMALVKQLRLLSILDGAPRRVAELPQRCVQRAIDDAYEATDATHDIQGLLLWMHEHHLAGWLCASESWRAALSNPREAELTPQDLRRRIIGKQVVDVAWDKGAWTHIEWAWSHATLLLHTGELAVFDAMDSVSGWEHTVDAHWTDVILDSNGRLVDWHSWEPAQLPDALAWLRGRTITDVVIDEANDRRVGLLCGRDGVDLSFEDEGYLKWQPSPVTRIVK
jgi:hypothetical protein